MTKTKKVHQKQDEEKVEEPKGMSAEEAAEAAAKVAEAKEAAATESAAPILPRFEGAQVVSIKEANVAGGQFHHCQMDNGTTMHVPVELFQPKAK